MFVLAKVLKRHILYITPMIASTWPWNDKKSI